MKNLLKIIGTAILFFGLSSSATAANTANNGLTQLSIKPLADSPYALDCKGTVGSKNCSLINKDKFKNSQLLKQGDGDTFGNAVAADSSGNVYITGSTNVGINGQKQHGSYDYFVIKYDANGRVKWTQQVGEAYGITWSSGIATDSSGNTYITGWTTVGINDQKQTGDSDYFVIKYDPNGKLQWTQQVGAAGGTTEGYGIAVDSGGNVYVTGNTNVGINGQQQHGKVDYFVAAYRSDGSIIWTDQVGGVAGDTEGRGIETDNNGNIYITGTTDAGINGEKQNGVHDYFIVKYYKNLMQWTQQVGAAGGKTEGNSIAIDNSGNVYVTGATNVGINGEKQNGTYDYFIIKYAASGIEQWAHQVGAAGGVALGNGVATDNDDDVYVTGYTSGINGEKQNGVVDYFLVKYTASGTEQWIRQVGADFGTTIGAGTATDNNGDVYITGSTIVGINGQPQNGYYDAFTTSYNPGGTLRWSRQVGG